MGNHQFKPDTSTVKMNNATRMLYYRAEFQSMGDVLKDNRMNAREFNRLMALLGLRDADRAAKVLWEKQKRAEGGRMTVEEYVTLMMDPAVDSKTNMWRKLFAEFDTDGSGFASRQDVIDGLVKMGVNVNEDMKNKITRMDSNKDGKIYYGDFLRMQLLQK